MGMSASQARLLTLTARLNRNEYRAQQISNAKIRLAQSTEDASDAYIQALNATNLTYTTYDESGNKNTQQLTGGVIYTYSSIKNQYGFVNAAGQLMVTEKDGGNYETSKNLEEFLDKYGLLGSLDEAKTIQVTNPAYTDAMNKYSKEIENWKSQKPDKSDNKYWKLDKVTVENSELYDKFVSGTDSGCWSSVMNDSAALYHLGDVLSHLLDVGKYTTSDGKNTFEIKEDLSNASPFYHWWTTGGSGGVNGNAATMTEIREQIKNMDCCGKTEDEYHQNCDKNQTMTQKIVDLLWDSQEVFKKEGNNIGSESYNNILDRAKHLVFYDLKYALNEEKEIKSFDQDAYDKDFAEWEAKEPQKEDVPQYIEKKVRQATNSDEAQWYINLWHRMNGESDYKAGYMNETEYDSATDGWVTDSKTGQSYAILEDGLMNDPEWIAFALKNSVITMEQVQYSNPNEAGTGLKNVAWTSIVYTSMTEMSEETSEKKRTKAEVIYEQAQRDIEELDKKYDNDLKQLDTEHNALQTEYESIQNVINKNVERTFKTFS